MWLGCANQGPDSSHNGPGALAKPDSDVGLSDQRPAFESVLQQLCTLYGSKKVCITPYHPQDSGAEEEEGRGDVGMVRQLTCLNLFL